MVRQWCKWFLAAVQVDGLVEDAIAPPPRKSVVGKIHAGEALVVDEHRRKSP
jgi:hypothetical protein